MNYLKQIDIKLGDITLEDSDAIVNAANPDLLGGGGVDGAIHRAAGSGLLAECRTIGGCEHGEVRITKGYNLKTKYIIHTPGPIYRDGKHGEKELLIKSYYNSMMLAKDNDLKSISFPAISTGVYNYPLEEACSVAVDTVIEFMENEDYIMAVRFVLFDRKNFEIYKNYLENYVD